MIQLRSPDDTWRAEAAILSLSNSDAPVVSILSSQLPGMLAKASNARVIQSEATLAGILKIKGAIPVLIGLLEGANQSLGFETFYSATQLANDPVGKALYNLSVRPADLRNPLESQNLATRERTIRLLLLINNEESRDVLSKHLSSESDPHLAVFIKSNGINASHHP